MIDNIQGFIVDKQQKYEIYFGGDGFIFICQIITKIRVRGEQMSVLTGKHFVLFKWINPVRYQVNNNQIKLIFL